MSPTFFILTSTSPRVYSSWSMLLTVALLALTRTQIYSLKPQPPCQRLRKLESTMSCMHLFSRFPFTFFAPSIFFQRSVGSSPSPSHAERDVPVVPEFPRCRVLPNHPVLQAPSTAVYSNVGLCADSISYIVAGCS
ncbi:hypothetical protein C8F04DRAFT_1129421 [Mycena alexandri]|uniref:Uncharacterized protein n=1 Tax=Mycena alexandri TaxID=1745969 RepID=A0AAD6WVR7_9AGAR|nr:hypothetical protein C8F04DRAFT_1129421 [Mycena alexandri]